MSRALLIIAPVLLIAASVSADVVENDSTRFVVCRNQGGQNIDGPYQLDGVPVHGPMEDYVESFAWDDIGFHGGSSQSFQESDVQHGIYSVELDVRTDAGGGTMGSDIALGYAEAYYEVRFTLSESTDFNVAGSYNAFGFINGAVSETEVRIDSLGGGSPSQVIAFTNDDCCPSVTVDGTLLPGDYAFIARCLAIVDHSFMMSYTDSNAQTNVTMTLDVPQPDPLGDMDCSGAVDLSDVAPFIQALLDPDGYDVAFPNCDRDRADMNEDTLRDGGDVSGFINAILTN